MYEIAGCVPSLGVYKMRESAGKAGEVRSWGNQTCDWVFVSKFVRDPADYLSCFRVGNLVVGLDAIGGGGGLC